jgi:hypothetical protein
MNLDNFDKNNDNTYNVILNNLTTQFSEFINNESNIYNFNDSLKNKLQTILTNIQKLKDKIKVLLFNIDDLKQQILDNETQINNNTKESQDIISKLNDDLINKNKFINENSVDELKNKYTSLENDNLRLSKENEILNEKVTTSENILNKFKTQLSDLTNNQSENIKNNKESELIVNQISEIVDNLNSDIDNHTSGPNAPSSDNDSGTGGVGDFFKNIVSPSSSNEQPKSFQQKVNYLSAINKNQSPLNDAKLYTLQKNNIIGNNKKGGKKTKKNKKYTKKNKKIVNKKKKFTKKSKKSKKNYKKQKGGFIVTKTQSSNKKSTNKTASSSNIISSNPVSSEKLYSNISSLRGKKQKQKNKNNKI